MSESSSCNGGKEDVYPQQNRPVNKHSEAFQIKVKNADSWRIFLTILSPLAAAALLWWLSRSFVTLDRYERERADDKVMQKEMRDDIKSILREVKK